MALDLAMSNNTKASLSECWAALVSDMGVKGGIDLLELDVESFGNKMQAVGDCLRDLPKKSGN